MALQTHRLLDAAYLENFADIHPPFETMEGAVLEANRCLYCYDAPCTKSCPTHIDIPRFIKQIASENPKGSAKTIFDSNIMGAGCARVCPVEKLCEGACVFNLMGEEPIAIAKLQRHATEKPVAEQWPLYQRKPSNGKKVAVVGAGPAGLACAHALSMEGVEVTIFEKEPRGGGLMTYGVAAYKVSPEFCAAEVNWITSIGGITMQYNQALGTNFSLESLRQQYDAVFLGIGVGITRPLHVPGEGAAGVVDAIEFIYGLRTRPYGAVPVGNRVVVIGMGMTAIDAATQSKRLGAEHVTLVYRRTEAEKPCTNVELDIARLDGCNTVWLAAPKAVLVENGQVAGLVCSKMRLGEPDASGRRSPEDTGETFTLEADMIIKATGQMPFEYLLDESKVVHQHGHILVDVCKMTNLPGVFAGGDSVNGGREVVDAVQEGKEAGRGILQYLQTL
jgi:glutamate synthase (NADPH/NADH) small chain